MAIQRYLINTAHIIGPQDTYFRFMVTDEKGDWIQHDDHLTALDKQRDGIAEMVEGIAKETSDADEMMVIRCVALAIRAFTQEEPPCESKEE